MKPRQIIVLQHSPPEPLGLIEPPLRARGFVPVYVGSFRGEPVPETIADAAGLVVLGGPMGVYEQDRHPFLRKELALIKQAIAADLPVLGICLGSQLVAAALGAEVRPGPGKEIGWHEVKLTPAAADDAIFAQAPATFTSFHWHGDVFSLPRGAVPLAGSAKTEFQAYRHGRATYGLLFHAEVTSTIVTDMTTAFADELNAEGIQVSAVLGDLPTKVAALNRVGEQLFARWADLLS
jgi:GMP synthase (glutamine-hydrolysing)